MEAVVVGKRFVVVGVVAVAAAAAVAEHIAMGEKYIIESNNNEKRIFKVHDHELC